MTDSRAVVQVRHWYTVFDIRPDEWGGFGWSQCVDVSDTRARMEAFEKGDLYVDGEKVDARVAKRLRAQITGKYVDMPQVYDPTEEGPTRPYIPGLWSHEAIPAFIGPKGFGKTKLLCQLAAALLIQSRRFLGIFEPVEMTEGERQRDLWFVNSETRPAAVHEELLAAGLEFGYRDGLPCYFDPMVGPHGGGVLIVEHLRKLGGATRFDLTDPVKWQWWENRLIEYTGRANPPLTILADGVTAMLGNDTSRYGAFASAFRRLLNEAGIPNGLGVLHSPMGVNADTPMGGVESMGEWDGMWIAHASAFPVNPWTRRSFWTNPRLGDPQVMEHVMALDESGLLRLLPRERPVPATEEVSGNESAAYEAMVLDALKAAGKAGLTSLELTGRSREGEARRAARDRLLDRGLIFSVRAGQHTRWYLAEFR